MSGREVSFIMCESLIQVDTSGCSLGLVDNKTKVAFKCKENILKSVLKRNGIFTLREKRNPRFTKIPNLWWKRKPLPMVLL